MSKQYFNFSEIVQLKALQAPCLIFSQTLETKPAQALFVRALLDHTDGARHL